MVFTTFLAIFLFLIICTLLGLSLNFFLKFTSNFDSSLYKVFSLLSIGFGFYFVLIFILGVFRIPLNIWIFLAISLILPIFFLIKKRRQLKNINLKSYLKSPSLNQIILLLILAVFFGLMLHGTFSYHWFEDGDPWWYALGAKYVALNQNYHLSEDPFVGWFYLFPQSPPGLSSMLGLLHQVTPDLYSLMKIFINLSLLIGVISFFLFCYHFSEKKHTFSLIATGILIITPCFAGHFIFNYTLSIALFLVFLLSLSFAFSDYKTTILAGLMVGGVILAHPIAGIQTASIMGILIIIYGLKEFKENKLADYFNVKRSIPIRIILIGLLGILVSLSLYGDIFFHEGNSMAERFSSVKERLGGSQGILSLNRTIQQSYDVEPNSIGEFFTAKKVSRMDQQEGVGLILFSLCLFGSVILLFRKKRLHRKEFIYMILFLWYFVFLWIITGRGIGVQNYRWWSIFAVFIALLAAATMTIILKSFKNNLLKFTIFALLVVGLVYTSAIPRYVVQSSQWPADYAWAGYEELEGYSSLRHLGYDHRIMSLCYKQKIIPFNQMNFAWDKEMYDYYDFLQNKTVEKNITAIINQIEQLNSEYDMEYLTVDASCVGVMGVNNTNALLQYYLNDSHYLLDNELSNSMFFLFKVVQ